jgi:hypothetical protein
MSAEILRATRVRDCFTDIGRRFEQFDSELDEFEAELEELRRYWSPRTMEVVVFPSMKVRAEDFKRRQEALMNEWSAIEAEIDGFVGKDASAAARLAWLIVTAGKRAAMSEATRPIERGLIGL